MLASGHTQEGELKEVIVRMYTGSRCRRQGVVQQVNRNKSLILWKTKTPVLHSVTHRSPAYELALPPAGRLSPPKGPNRTQTGAKQDPTNVRCIPVCVRSQLKTHRQAHHTFSPVFVVLLLFPQPATKSPEYGTIILKTRRYFDIFMCQHFFFSCMYCFVPSTRKVSM